MRDPRGQVLIEYVLFVTAVLIVCIYFFTVGPMKQSVSSGLNGMVHQINVAPYNAQIVLPP
jgi:hypothetical protein